jgi:RHS repeat-associated protein
VSLGKKLMRGDAIKVVPDGAAPNTARWTAGSLYRLGSQNPQDNTTWGLLRVELPNSVAPGASVTFSFNVTAPATVGTYNFQWRMVQDNVEWFGAYTTNAAVSVQGAPIANVYYIYTDQLNTPRAITNEAATPVWKWDNVDPFGANVPNEDPDGDTNKFVFNLRFPGQYFDRETNTHYNYFRDYDPAIGRYIESDPIGLLGGINTYTYPATPLNTVDVLGFAGTGRTSPNVAAGSPLPFLALSIAAPVFPFAEYRGAPQTECGPAGGFAFQNTFDGISVENACARHDKCYGQDCGVGKDTCDKEFLDRMKQSCGNQPRCLIGAYSYYWFVRWKGEDAFIKAREDCRNGQCKPTRTW